jgi:hypothetical protein
MAACKEKEKQDHEKLAKSNWTCWRPPVCLYLAMGSDSAHQTLIDKDRVLTRHELDSRNSDVRPKNFFHVVLPRTKMPRSGCHQLKLLDSSITSEKIQSICTFMTCRVERSVLRK